MPTTQDGDQQSPTAPDDSAPLVVGWARADRQARASGGEVLGVHAVDELPELLDDLVGHGLGRQRGGLVEDLLGDEDAAPDPHGEGDGVGRPARHHPDLAGGR